MKKIISIVLCIILLIFPFTTTINAVLFNAETAELGDVNSDDKINALDSYTIKKYIVDRSTTLDSVASDINGDGSVTTKDNFYLKLLILGKYDNNIILNGKLQSVSIANVSISKFVIVYNSDEPLNVKYAANELHDYIEKATGLNLSLIENDGSYEYTHGFVFSTAEELGDEGIDISVENGNVHLKGGALRGCMYAAYDFLERFLGYVFINYDYEYINAKSKISIADGEKYSHIPKVKDRDSQTYSYQANMDAIESALKLKISSWKNRGILEKSEKYGYSVGYVGSAHTMADFAPTFVPSNSSKVCWNSIGEDSEGNPITILEETYNNVIAKIESLQSRGYPVPRISVSPMDNDGYCTCRTCKNINRAEESTMGAHLTFINELAEMIGKVYPDIHIMTTAYWIDRKPPKTLVCRDNVDILYCWAGCSNHPMNGSECYEEGNRLWYNNIKESDNFEKWCEKCDTIYVWIYATSYSYMLGEPSTLDNMREDIKYLADHGVYGIYCEGFYGTSKMYKDGNCFDLLLMYMYMRCQWDPDMTDEEFDLYVNEFLELYYGPGYEYVREFIDLNSESTDATKTCWCNNCDLPFDCMSIDFWHEHSDRVFYLMDTALEMTETDEQIFNLEHLAASAYWLCLCGDYTEVFENGSEEQRELYSSRYRTLYNWMVKYPLVNLDDETQNFNAKDDYDVENPYNWTGYSVYHNLKTAKDPTMVYAPK